jgi:4-amino-4-deoxy-L-arabinose transferase-like glycosyltransferase
LASLPRRLFADPLRSHERSANPVSSIGNYQRVWLLVLLAVFAVLACSYSIVAPPFEAPDEIWHLGYINYLADGRGLPVASPNTKELWRQQGIQAPGYYAAAALLTGWIDQSDFPALYERINPYAKLGQPDAATNRNFFIHHKDETWPWHGSVLVLHIARFLSVFLGMVTVYAVYRSLSLVIGPELALLGASLIALIPQFIFLSSAVSNDNAAIATSALVIWRSIALVSSPPVNEEAPGLRPQAGKDGKSYLIIGCCLGLALLSKLNAIGLVAIVGLAVVILAVQRRSTRVLWEAALFIGIPTILIAGWWYYRNWVLYGNPLAWNMWEANVLQRVVPAGWNTIYHELGSLEWSFWGLFGWVNVGYPSWVYVAIRGLELFFAAGFLIGLVGWLRRPAPRRLPPGFLILLAWLVVLIVSWVRFTREAPAAQGRYLFPAFPAWALLIALGLRGWRPPRGIPIVNATVLASLVLAALAAPIWVLRPAYLPPASAVLPPDATRLEVRLGGKWAITGVAAEPATLMPGQSARVKVAWRALAPDSVDYSVFVHLENAQGLVIAQADTMPGAGSLPTSQWQPGQERVESYDITVPGTAYAPDKGRWVVGMYDPRTGERLPAVLQTDAGGGPPAASVEAGGLRFGRVVVVSRPGAVPNPLAIDFLDNITLAGYSFSSREILPGQQLSVKLYWQARGPVAGRYAIFAHLLDEHFDTFGANDSRPSVPTTGWRDVGIVADEHTFTVSLTAGPGLYQVEIGLYPPGSSDRLLLEQSAGAEGADRVLLGPIRVLVENQSVRLNAK